jgi:uncharacterized protein
MNLGKTMLFADQSKLMGTFKGSTDKNLEFSAEIVTEYNENMLDTPQLGQFLLIELAHEEEASLGRITRFVPSGLLASTEGEDYLNAMQKRHQPVDEKLKKQYLKYRVQVKLLGAVKVKDERIIYVPSQRRLPHLGAKVTLPSDKVLEALCGLSQGKTSLGYYVLGEFVFCGNSTQQNNPALCSMNPELKVTFDMNHLVSKRSLIFARAGYGKSNLMKYLMTELYQSDPETESGMPVGTLIFDPDGEYFWADKVKGRPGLCDVPHLKDKIMVFTNNNPPNSHYGSWKIGEVKLDIRDLLAREVISIAVAAHRQGDQNVLKLKAMSKENWRKMVDLLQTEGLQASDEKVGELLGYNEKQIPNSLAEIGAARSNMYGVVKALHDPESKLLSGTIHGLKQGKIVVVDISLLSSTGGNILAGLLLRYLFNHNQENFTGGEKSIIPVIVVIEEAQSVLGRNLDDTSPFVEWVKEGRKYDLGAILITQQPGSMAPEILSQADNWFCFHLLSEGDAKTLGKYNAHYSDDILAHLIGEPIAGNCYMWSAPHQPFVLPVRVSSFEDLYKENVKLDSNEKTLEQVAAQDVKREVSESLNKLKESFLEVLKKDSYFDKTKNRTGRVGFRDKGNDLCGIKEGSLFYIIKSLKSYADTQSENQLRDILFGLIFGEGKYQKLGTGNDVYYCATKEQWEEVLGKLPKYSPKEGEKG